MEKGDLLAVVQILQNCGGPALSSSSVAADTVYRLASTFTSGVLGAQAFRHVRLEAVASNGFHLDSHAAISYPDITASLGQSGIGTLDIYTSTYTPEAARVFNDVGAAGRTA